MKTLYAGIDLHKKYSVVSIIDEKDEIIQQKKILNDNAELKNFFDAIPNPLEIGIEATFNSYWFNDLIETEKRKVYIGNARQIKAIGAGAAKTDKIDAHILARLVRSQMFPKIIKPTEADIIKKEEVRSRYFLVKLRSQIKNKIHSYLLRYNIKHEYGTKLFTKKGIKWLKKETGLPEYYQENVNKCLKIYEKLEQEIEEKSKKIEEKYKNLPEIKLLKTIPEIGTYRAVLLMGEIGDIKRFKTGKKLVNYFGMAPKVYQSAERNYGGHITRQGSKYARWAIGEAVQKLERTKSQMGDQYRQLLSRVGKNKAKIAMGQKLVKIIHYCLTTGEAYQRYPTKKKDLKEDLNNQYRSNKAISAECERTS